MGCVEGCVVGCVVSCVVGCVVGCMVGCVSVKKGIEIKFANPVAYYSLVTS